MHDRIGARDVAYKIDNSTILYDITKVNGSNQVGLAVTFSTDDTVKLAADGEFVLGKLIKVEADLTCVVQESGHMKLPAGTGATLTIGKMIVGALLSAAPGFIREVATGTPAELGRSRGFIHNNDDTANVGVYLP